MRLRTASHAWARLLGPVLLLILAIGADRALANVTTLAPIQDNTIYSEGDLSNGAGDHVFSGRTNGDPVRRALIQFDIAGAIPAGATINSVTLTLTRNKGKNASPSMPLHRLLAAWGEGTSDAPDEEGAGASATTGDATWMHTFYPTSTWTSPGGDYVGSASATTVVGNSNGPYTWSSATMVSDVQGWLDTPSSNHGWILIGDESSTRTARRFDSRTSPTVSARPTLEIDFTPAEVSGACCLGDNCDLLTAAECANQAGVYQGDGTSCSPNPCIVPTGACCFDNTDCSELSEADCLAQSGTYQGDGSVCTVGLCPLVLTPFVDPLPLPAVATPTSGTSGGVATYDIEMQEILQQLHQNLPPTRLWGYDGLYPGPTIEASVGQQVTVNWINDLRDSTGALRTEHYLPVDLCMHGPDTEGPTPRTVVHLHGGHVPPESDGYPEDTFLPGNQATYVYENNQLPATLWYHDHALGITRLNVMMGLAGAYLLRDDFENALNLPANEFEIPLVIQDRSFNPDGTLSYPATWQDHFFGDKIVVNGKVWPFLNVQRGKYRFRLFNGSNSRAYTLTLSTGDPFNVIGTDGGLLTTPVVKDTLTMTPGERIDVVVDFESYSPNTEIILQNSAPAPFPGTPGVGVIPEIMKFIVQGGGGGFTDPLPDTLRVVTPLPDTMAVMTREFVLKKQSDPCAGSIWTINGLGWTDITEYPVLGDTEIWEFVNDSGVAHPMHMHLVMFQVLNRQPFITQADSIVPVGDPIPPDPSEAGWKDTAPVYPGEILRVIARFEGYTGLYAYHCHILEHEDHEMMRQFQVVASPVDVPGNRIPYGFVLQPNYPNPFNPSTTVRFELPGHERVLIRVFDARGRLVRVLFDEQRGPGAHELVWDGRNDQGTTVSAGTYFLELQAGGKHSVRKATVVK
jgi:spore coat protein A